MEKLQIDDGVLSDFVKAHRGYNPDSDQIARCRRIIEGTVLNFFGAEVRSETLESIITAPVSASRKYKDRSSLSLKVRRLFKNPVEIQSKVLAPVVYMSQLSTKDAYTLAQGTKKEFRATFCWSSEILKSRGVVPSVTEDPKRSQVLGLLEKVFEEDGRNEGLQTLKYSDITSAMPKSESVREKMWMSFDGERICRERNGVEDVLMIPCMIVADICSFLYEESEVIGMFGPNQWILVGPGRLVVVNTVTE